ncbi:hypothetical protein QBC36DRAFT_314573 [Triangularia setosa]|uniref:Uncharacterized protein n=1 Tax=Triangularia setosa TaxID=2587417 RepID=A0AAN6W1T4_9PEZI|nr:hypothetical protein QBC36DRAFT_314573 [Podospora setosa]
MPPVLWADTRFRLLTQFVSATSLFAKVLGEPKQGLSSSSTTLTQAVASDNLDHIRESNSNCQYSIIIILVVSNSLGYHTGARHSETLDAAPDDLDVDSRLE